MGACQAIKMPITCVHTFLENHNFIYSEYCKNVLFTSKPLNHAFTIPISRRRSSGSSSLFQKRVPYFFHVSVINCTWRNVILFMVTVNTLHSLYSCQSCQNPRVMIIDFNICGVSIILGYKLPFSVLIQHDIYQKYRYYNNPIEWLQLPALAPASLYAHSMSTSFVVQLRPLNYYYCCFLYIWILAQAVWERQD